MWFFSDTFWINYKSETGYKELELAIREIVADELEKEEKLEEEYIEKVKAILDWQYKGNWVVEIWKGSCKVYV